MPHPRPALPNLPIIAPGATTEPLAPAWPPAGATTSTATAHAVSLDSARWCSTEEVARLLGVDASTLRRWRNQTPPAGPPFYPLAGRTTVYSLQDILAWIAGQRVDTEQAA